MFDHLAFSSGHICSVSQKPVEQCQIWLIRLTMLSLFKELKKTLNITKELVNLISLKGTLME